MSNTYIQFSEMIPDITCEERQWMERELMAPVDWFEKFSPHKDSGSDKEYEVYLESWLKDHPLNDPDGHECWPDFDWSFEQDKGEVSLWIRSATHGNLDNLAIFVQAFLKKFRPDFIFRLTYAVTCSKPEEGAFGGGHLVVAKDATITGDSWESAEAGVKIMEDRR